MARGATEFESLDSWLGHKTRGGGGGKFLSKWKEKEYCDTWFHTQRLPLAIWRHSFPMFVLIKDKETREEIKHVFSKKFTCHEDESVLTNPWRDRNTGLREHPPQRCLFCKLNDYLWIQCQTWVDTHSWNDETKKWVEIKKGKGAGIDPCTMLFNLESDAKDDENVQLYAGGICNFFGKKELEDDVVNAMKKAKIRGDMTWKQNANVKCEYALCVVDNDNIEAGVQIAVECQALGEKIKEVIQKVYKSQEINIQKSPYCVKWEYFPKKDFSKKYDSTAMMKITPSPRVLKLIRGEAPDLSELKKPFNQQSIRSILEQHCLVKDFPWDEIAPTKAQEKAWAAEDEEAEREEEATHKASPKASAADADDDDADDNDAAEPDEDEDMVACDECTKPMKLSASECPHCGHKYEVETEEEEKPAPKAALPSRAELAKKKAAEAKTSSKPKPAKDDEDDDTQGSEIPF